MWISRRRNINTPQLLQNYINNGNNTINRKPDWHCSWYAQGRRLTKSHVVQQNLTSKIAMQRGFAECSDLVKEHLTKYRTAWVKKFSNKPVPEIVELWTFAGGSTNRTCNYSSKLFDVVRQNIPKSKTRASYGTGMKSSLGGFVSTRHDVNISIRTLRRRKRSRSSCSRCLMTSLKSLIKAYMNLRSLNITNMSEWRWRN